MTTRTRLFLSLATAVVVVGLSTALAVSYFGLEALSLAGPAGSAELEYIPAGASVVAFADVHQLMTSQLRQKFRDLRPDANASGGFEAQTGINPETDITYVVSAVLHQQGDNRRPLVLARGLFDEVKVEGLIRDRGGKAEDYKGERLLILAGDGDPVAATFAETGLLVFGPLAAVRTAIDTKASSANVSGNDELMRLVKEVNGTNLWAVGRFDAIAGAGRLPPNVSQQLPPINLFAASGQVESDVKGTLRAEARDATAAQNLRQVIQGFIAFGRLQAGANPALSGVLDTVQVAGEGATVALSFTIPADALDALAPRLRPREQAAFGF
jgi:hypothetical protein